MNLLFYKGLKIRTVQCFLSLFFICNFVYTMRLGGSSIRLLRSSRALVMPHNKYGLGVRISHQSILPALVITSTFSSSHSPLSSPSLKSSIHNSHNPSPSSLEGSKRNINSLENKFLEALQKDCLVGTSTNILVCVSGGVDSMALLHLLANLHTTKPGHFFQRLEVVTFNHKLRPEADEEVQFVQSIASSYGLRCHIVTALPSQLLDDKGMQARSRAWRTTECLKIIENNINNNSIDNSIDSNNNSKMENKQDARDKCDNSSKKPSQWMVAMAHHSDDQLETLLLKFLRGVHISQIRGMKPRTTVNVEPSTTGRRLHVIRPLLSISKAELKDYLVMHNRQWREDASNLSRKYKRNVVRNDLIPLLSTLAGGTPALKDRLSNLEFQSQGVNDWIKSNRERLLRDHFPHMENNAFSCIDDDDDDDVDDDVDDGVLNEYQAINHTGDASDKTVKPNRPLILDVSSNGTYAASHIMIQLDLLFTLASTACGEAISFDKVKRIHELSITPLGNGIRSKTADITKSLSVKREGNVLKFIPKLTPSVTDTANAKATAKANAKDKAKATSISTSKGTIGNVVNSTSTSTSTCIWEDHGVTLHAPPGLSVQVQPLNHEQALLKDTELKSQTRRWDDDIQSCLLMSVPTGECLEVRRARNGDKFRPSWRSDQLHGAVKLTAFMRLQSIPVHKRDDVWIISSATTGRVVAVPPYVSLEYSNNYYKAQDSVEGLEEAHAVGDGKQMEAEAATSIHLLVTITDRH